MVVQNNCVPDGQLYGMAQNVARKKDKTCHRTPVLTHEANDSRSKFSSHLKAIISKDHQQQQRHTFSASTNDIN